jgi:hypothetical protein
MGEDMQIDCGCPNDPDPAFIHEKVKKVVLI